MGLKGEMKRRTGHVTNTGVVWVQNQESHKGKDELCGRKLEFGIDDLFFVRIKMSMDYSYNIIE